MSQSAPLIVQIAEPVAGGVERQLELLAATLPERGWRLHFLLSLERPGCRADFPDELRARGCEVDLIPMTRAPRPAADWRAYRQIRRHLAKLRPDLVHTHSSKAGQLGRRAAGSLNLPAVHTPHVFPFEWHWTGWRGWLYRRLERRAAQWCRRLIVLTDAQAENALRAGLGPLEQLEVIPNGVDIDRFRPPTPEERAAARAHFGLADDEAVVGTAARLEPQKGFDDLLHAASLLAGLRDRTKLLIAGEGSRLEECRRQAATLGLARRVVFLGQIAEMEQFYWAVDAFVLASLYEGLPYALLEALACGRPAVATRTAGAEALIADKESGLLTPVADPEPLAAALNRILADPALAERLGAWGRTRIAERFRLDTWAQALSDLYCRVLGEV